MRVGQLKYMVRHQLLVALVTFGMVFGGLLASMIDASPAFASPSGQEMMLYSDGRVYGWNTQWTPETYSGSGTTAIATDSYGLQLRLDNSGNVWAASGTRYPTWTEEVVGGIKAISIRGGTQLILDNSGNVWAQSTSTISTTWTEEVSNGSIAAIATGDSGLQLVLDNSGVVWARTSIGSTAGWTQETPTGEAAISAGSVQMILDGAGQVWAKNSVGYGNWTQETPAGETAIAAGENGLQMLLDDSGRVWAKTSVSYGGWTQETPTGETKIAAGVGQMLIDSAGQVWDQDVSSLSTNWTQESTSDVIAIATD